MSFSSVAGDAVSNYSRICFLGREEREVRETLEEMCFGVNQNKLLIYCIY